MKSENEGEYVRYGICALLFSIHERLKTREKGPCLRDFMHPNCALHTAESQAVVSQQINCSGRNQEFYRKLCAGHVKVVKNAPSILQLSILGNLEEGYRNRFGD